MRVRWINVLSCSKPQELSRFYILYGAVKNWGQYSPKRKWICCLGFDCRLFAVFIQIKLMALSLNYHPVFLISFSSLFPCLNLPTNFREFCSIYRDGGKAEVVENGSRVFCFLLWSHSLLRIGFALSFPDHSRGPDYLEWLSQTASHLTL